MIRRVVNRIGLAVMVSAAVLLGAYLSGAAEEQELTVEASLVPALDTAGNPPAITFSEGKIKIKDKKGKVRLKIKDISVPEGTEGTLVLSLMVNAEEVNVEFPFVVEDDDDAGTSKVDVKAFLPDVLDTLVTGDTLEFLGARAFIADDPIAVTGIIFKPKVLAGNAGQLIYEEQCASCHRLGSFDTDGFASDLAQDGDDLVTDLGTIDEAMAALDPLTDQELQDLAAFLDSFTPPGMANTGPGQLVWEAKECGSCHRLGSFDTEGFADDLAQHGDELVNDLGTINEAMAELVLTNQELQDLAPFLDSFTP